jgi:hypothetical protein
MPNSIDLLATEGTNLDWTLQRALTLLQERGISTIGAAQIVSVDKAPVGRILLLNVADKARSIQILTRAKFFVSVY